MAIAPLRAAYSMRALSRKPSGGHDALPGGAIKEDGGAAGPAKEARKSMGSPAVPADMYLSARQRAASAEAELRRLRGAYDARSSLLADLSHDLRNALSGILGLNSLLEKTVTSPEQQQLISLQQAAADQALATANGMLDLGRAEMGTLELDAEDFDVRAVAEDAIDTVIVDSFSRGFDILCFVEPNVPEMARGCAPRIKQVIVALLRFLQQGNVEVIIGLDSETARDHTLFVSITDETVSGEAFTDLLHRFHSTEHHTHDQPGLGVSMLLAKRLVELMGGQIELREAEGGGATASFTVLCHRTRGSRPAMPGPLPDILSPALLVSPVRPAHAILASLSSWGVEAVVVESVAEAITALERRSFGSVLVSLSSGGGPLSARTCAQVLTALRASNPKKAHFWMVRFSAVLRKGNRSRTERRRAPCAAPDAGGGPRALTAHANPFPCAPGAGADPVHRAGARRARRGGRGRLVDHRQAAPHAHLPRQPLHRRLARVPLGGARRAAGGRAGQAPVAERPAQGHGAPRRGRPDQPHGHQPVPQGRRVHRGDGDERAGGGGEGEERRLRHHLHGRATAPPLRAPALKHCARGAAAQAR